MYMEIMKMVDYTEYVCDNIIDLTKFMTVIKPYDHGLTNIMTMIGHPYMLKIGHL